MSHPGIREAAAGVEGGQQTMSQLFGHVQELVLVPQHALSAFLQHDGHGVASQQPSEHTQHTAHHGTSKSDITGGRWIPSPDLRVERVVSSPQDADVGLEHGHHDVVVKLHVFQDPPHGRFELYRLVQHLGTEMRGRC